MKPKSNSALEWAMRIRDPIVRKQAVANVKAQPKWKYIDCIGCTDKPILRLFNWDDSKEGFSYWLNLYTKHLKTDTTFWSEHLIYDELPDEYWIENSNPGNATDEWKYLWNKATEGDSSWGRFRWYKANKKGKIYGKAQDNTPADTDIILQYDNWKELVEAKYGKKEEVVPVVANEYKEGDWVKVIKERVETSKQVYKGNNGITQ